MSKKDGLVEKLTDGWIEQWLLKRLGKGNRFEQFNYQFCRDLIADATPIIQKAARSKAFEDIQKTVSGKCWEEIDRLMHKGEGGG